MQLHMPRRYHCALGLLALVFGVGAHASIHDWSFVPVLPGEGVFALSNTGGYLYGISSRFDSDSRRLQFSIDFADRVTEGFSLVLTGGDNPLGVPGLHSVIYFDAAGRVRGNSSAPIRLTSYGFNGRLDSASWYDGDGDPANDSAVSPAADPIKSALDTGWIHSASVTDMVLAGGFLGRRMSFDVDASDLIGHAPLFNRGPSSWQGAGFEDRLGIYLQTARIFETEYSPSGDLTYLGTERQGTLVAVNMPTIAPAPGALALAAAGIGVFARRRRT